MERLLAPHQLVTKWLYALGVCLVLGAMQYAHAEGSGRIVKWKDEKGVTHYGDTIPMQYLNQESSQINRQGVTVKHNKPAKTTDNTDELALEQSKLEQTKKDKALLSAFTNAEEIDLALERNIQLDNIALQNLQQEKLTQQKSLDTKKAMAATFQQRKKNAPKELITDINEQQAKVDSVDEKIATRNAAISATTKRFDDDKKRYLLLKSPPIKDTP